MHEHNECQHELKHCEHCDVVYCKKCKREWGKKETVYVPYYVYEWKYPNWNPTWITTTGSTFTYLSDNTASTVTTHNHLDKEQS